jgi:signal transduction histidine kinase
VKNEDSRVNAKRWAWSEYPTILIVMLCLTSGQTLILSKYIDLWTMNIPLSFILVDTGYWGFMTLVFCLIIRHTRRKTWEEPMRMLSGAAKRVADGDFSVHIAPLRRDGKKDYIEVMFEDFNRMVEELGSIEMLTGDFVSNVSHEIKTPLSVIQSYAAALQKLELNEEMRREYTDTIIVAAKHLDTLVTNVLKLSKLETQEFRQDERAYDLCAQLAECALQFEEQWESKGITFTASMDDKAIIRTDAELALIVWSNLLSNALKFTKPGGTVTLSQTSDENTITVSVTDTGCGMSESTMTRIFDKFYQGDTSHSQEGNGLGLALAKRVIELLGGQISAKSSLGKGSTFTVSLKTTPQKEAP